MELNEMTVKDFTALLSSDAPAPGGGAAAALSGALGAALVNMVAALTVNKKAYADQKELMQNIIVQACGLRQGLVDLINKDAEAFNAFSEAMAMPKDTDEEKAVRTQVMQQALKNCTIAPFEIMKCSFSALELTDRAVGTSNKTVISDLGVAALSLKASVQAAWLNVLVNTKSIKDEDFTRKYLAEAEQILLSSNSLADKIYSEVFVGI